MRTISQKLEQKEVEVEDEKEEEEEEEQEAGARAWYIILQRKYEKENIQVMKNSRIWILRSNI